MLNLVDKNLQQLEEKHYGTAINVQHLDVSFNQLSRGIQFKPFVNLVTLIIDDNMYSSLSDFPTLKKLQTFSANKNNFADLGQFLIEAKDRFGQLKNLSMLKNPMNPFFEGEAKYNIYRDKIFQTFPLLVTMDGCAVKIMKKDIEKKIKKQEQKYDVLSGVAVYDVKYATEQVRSVKTKSEGNRFLKNNQL